MTAQLAEIVFEDVLPERVLPLARSFGITQGLTDEMENTVRSFLAQNSGDAMMTIGLHASWGKFYIDDLAVRLLRYDGHVDVEFTWRTPGSTPEDLGRLVRSVHEQALAAARKNGNPTFYGGIEPAVDKETRFFTNEVLGPLHFPTSRP